MTVKAMAPWFGSNRLLAANVGELLSGCNFVAVPFAGGMSELFHIKARTLIVNDLHRHVINLAAVVADPALNENLIARLDALPFHPDVLAAAQQSCRQREDGTYVGKDCPLWWAADYFVCSWMARNGKAGTDDEFSAGLSFRWEAGGGDSAVRFRNAAAGLADWHKIMRRCTFTTLDVFDFLAKCKDQKGHGIYCDPPFPGPGDAYKHKFGAAQHAQLAARLGGYTETRVVCRFYDVPTIRELYAERDWTWHHLTGRKQTNDAAPEFLLVRN